MTVYALDLDKVQHTIRETLVSKVLPAIESDSAKGELHAVIEMLDNLAGRLAWAAEPREETLARTRDLAARLGIDDVPADLPAARRELGDALAAAYADGNGAEIARAVAEFTAADVRAEISKGLLPGLPD
ncbi:hypothetical protein [Mycolicibacterium elephantis]|uniref:Uncharacterized protein n=1 Tax=Mycolicibacterium elephantis DSM 44368 TaxID=1335622 RepID=A0A439DN07_9MYCO|nr:hypothetical protein [Mycolicibacterium elephantis]MCV7220317.1 hypothetical protein [Mycolicibacterium elephantis]RWA16401.1 hypothetical protein MELE44368_07250 [Mycolicibacterium elephantis DSM 44368]